jgi:hypothetical protein
MSRIVPTTPNNSLTPSYSSVPSTNGFSSGDLVYYKDSNFGVIPANAVSTGTFPIPATVVPNRNFTNPTIQNVWTENTSPSGGNNVRADFSAQLSNGNIVVVMCPTSLTTTAYPYFKIIDQNGNQVVAKTQVTSVYYPYQTGTISVCALTGGGFVVAFCEQGGSYSLRYRVYDNSGNPVTALLQDASLLYAMPFTMTGLANGGFVIAANTTANGTGISTRVYSSTGVQGALTSSTAMYNTTGYPTIVRALSDNSFYVLAPSSSTQLNMYRYSTTGSYVGSYSVGNDYWTSGQYAMDVLANGTFALVYVESSSGIYYSYGKIFDPATNTVTSSSYVNSTYSLFNEIKAIPSGGFMYLSNNDGIYGGMYIYKCNNGFGTIASTIAYNMPGMTNNYAYSKYDIIIGATYYTILWSGNVSPSYTFGGGAYIQILPSDLSFRKTGSASITVGTGTANVNGYARSGSSPNSASFLAATTQTLTANQASISGTNFTLTPYVPFSDAITWQSMCTMQDNRFVIAYTVGSGSTGTVKFSVFNFDGSLYSTTTVATNTNIGQGLVRCVCLKNGKLVITWGTSGNDIVIKVYSSTYSLLATQSVVNQTGYSITTPDYYSFGSGHGLAPWNDNCFVIGFYSSSYGGVYVMSFNDSGGYIHQANTGASGTWYDMQVYASPGGTITLRGFYTGGGYCSSFQFGRGTSANYVAYCTQYQNSQGNTNYYNSGGAVSPTGVFHGMYNYSGNTYVERSYFGTGWTTLYIDTFYSGCMGDIAIGANGIAVSLTMPSNNSAPNYVYTFSSNLTASPFGRSNGSISTASFTANDKNTGGGPATCPRIISLYDNTFAFSYITNNGLTLKVGLLNVGASTYSTTLTAGTTVSQPALYPSPANGYYLAGVAASDCSAGGTGVVQTNGTTTLNSQYPSTTSSQAFDFTTNTVSGVKGTIAGRNVVLKGA